MHAMRHRIRRHKLNFPVRIGISACLTGQSVRYNGGHLNDSFLTETLAPHVEWVTVCPEVETGMGIPREQVRLVGDPISPQLVGSRSGVNRTARMMSWAGQRLTEIAEADLDGFVFAKNSPSCGLYRVRVHGETPGALSRQGVGLFARALREQMPGLPVEENGRLHDPYIRENFVERIFVHRRWREMLAQAPTPKGLVAFHTAHKLTFMAHSNSHYRLLGRIVAGAGNASWTRLVKEYEAGMNEALGFIATSRKHTNVLYHLMGFLKKKLPAPDKQELLEIIDSFRSGQLPLIVPITLLRHHLRREQIHEWVHQQTYLDPYPEELALRNHV